MAMPSTRLKAIHTNQPLVYVKDGKMVTDSLIVSRFFGKEHSNVVRDIRSLLNKVDREDPEWGFINFETASYKHHQNHQTYKKYVMSEQGFGLLVMGYTGSGSTSFKLQFLKEFARIRSQSTTPTVENQNDGRFTIEEIQPLANSMMQTAMSVITQHFDLVPKSIIDPPSVSTNQVPVETPVMYRDISEATLTATELGEQLTPKLSAPKVNYLLSALGLLERELDENGKKHWRLTVKGKKYGVETEFMRSIRIRWFPTVLNLLRSPYRTV